MSKKIYLYFAKPFELEACKEISRIAVIYDASMEVATYAYMRFEIENLSEPNHFQSKLDSIFGLVFQKFIQAPTFKTSFHYEGRLELPMLILEKPEVIHKTTGEVLTLTISQWNFIGKQLEDHFGIEFLEARDDLIPNEEVFADEQRPSKYELKERQILFSN